MGLCSTRRLSYGPIIVGGLEMLSPEEKRERGFIYLNIGWLDVIPGELVRHVIPEVVA